MTKKWMAISLLMFIVVCLLGWWLHNSIDKFNADNDLNNLQPSPDMMQNMAEELPLPQPPESNNYIPEEFAVIPENNVFSESRSREEETTEDAPQVDVRPLSQKPVLVGINITDSEKTVLLIDPRASSQGQNRRAAIKRVGDVYQGHTIADIAPDHIVLESASGESGSRKEIIPLHEGSKGTAGGRTPILSTRVVSLSGGNASGGVPIAVANKVNAARTAAAPKPAAASEPQAASTAAATVTPVSQASPEAVAIAPPTQRSQQRSQTVEPGAPKTRVVRTPFGDVVRPVRD